VGRVATLVTLAAWCASARAGGLVVEGGSPRAVGRAGTGTVGDDGGGALVVNPAAMARRDTTRAQVGVTVSDDTIEWKPIATGATVARDQAGSTLLPLAAVEGAIGDWIIGAGVMTTAASERALRSPVNLSPDEYGNHFEYRYAGLASAMRRDTATIGIARRLGEDVAVGLAVAGSRVSLREERAVWADHRTNQTPGDPTEDVDIAIDAQDTFTPSVTAGILIAPEGTRLELGGSFTWAAAAHVSGPVAAAGASATSVEASAATASLGVREPLTARAGVRYNGSHWIGELDADVWLMPDTDEVWQVSGLGIVDATGTSTDLTALPSRLSTHTHGAVRGSLDVELVAGFLWATAGYAYTSAATPGSQLSPTFGELASQTAAAGLEANAGGFTITLGWARTWSLAHTLPGSAWHYDNPYAVPDAAIPGAHLDGARDLIGISIDAELDSSP
jgi:long-subunit fatty acid transport protein